MRDQHLYWLPFLAQDVPAELTDPIQVARFELDLALPQLAPELQVYLAPDADADEGFSILRNDNGVTISGGPRGILYGAYKLLMALAAGESLPRSHSQQPKYALRMINCWDNADGDIERGYSGRSLFFESGRFDYDPIRLRQL